MKFSVVISTYLNERSDYFKSALFSVADQTIVPNEIVVVFDGPVLKEQRTVTEEMIKLYPNISFVIVDLIENVGRGLARNIGVNKAKHDVVAIMDSDDVSMTNRFEEQLKVLYEKDVDVVAAWQEEFRDGSDRVQIKKCPENDVAIKKSLKFRNLIPNPSVMFKKDMFLSIGGYGDNKFMGEDHVLFARFAQCGSKFYCIQYPLIKVRVDDNQRKRRGSLEAMIDDIKVRRFLYRINYINVFELISTSIIFSLFRLSPTPIKNLVFNILRDKK